MKICIIISVIFLFLNSVPIFAHNSLRLVNDPWPPYTSDDLPDKGLATKLVQTALTRANYQSTVDMVPWKRALNGTFEGEYDILLTASYDVERAKKVLYSVPYLQNTIQFASLKYSPHTYTNLTDLKDLRIGTIRGYLYSEEFDDAQYLIKDDGAVDMISNLKKLQLNRLDLIIGDAKVMNYYIQKHFSPDTFIFLPKAINTKTMHIIIRKSHPKARDIITNFNHAFASMKADGTYEAILSSYRMNTIKID